MGLKAEDCSDWSGGLGYADEAWLATDLKHLNSPQLIPYSMIASRCI